MDWQSALETVSGILPPEGWLALALGLAAGAWLARWMGRLRQRWMAWRSRNVGRRGETRALKLLKKAGYTIVEEQVEGQMAVEVDGHLDHHTVRADVLVERDGQRWIAEVKSGASGARPAASAS